MSCWRHLWFPFAIATVGVVIACGKEVSQTENLGFAGSRSCMKCHVAEWEQWKYSHHGLAEVVLEPGEVTIPTKGVKVDNAQENARQAVRQIGVAPLKQFLVEHQGNLQVHQLAQDSSTGEWFDVFADGRETGEWGHWTGRGMNWASMCAVCHNTGVEKSWDEKTDRFITEVAEFGVGCEACHGPAGNHVEWQGTNSVSTADPFLASLQLVNRPGGTVEACGPCHARRAELTSDPPASLFLDGYLPSLPDESETWYADGQIREENFEYGSFLMSKMHGAGVTCLDCHSAHTAKPTLSGNALCMQCHAGGGRLPGPVIDEFIHSGHIVDTPGSSCVNCHMPSTTYMQRHPRRDHSFTIPDPVLTQELGVPNACNRCHTDQTPGWASAEISKRPGWKGNPLMRKRAMAVAAAREGRQDALPRLLEAVSAEAHPTWTFILLNLLTPWVGQAEVDALLQEAAISPHALIRTAGYPSPELLQDGVLAVRLAAAQKIGPSLPAELPVAGELWQELKHNQGQPAAAMREAIYWMDRQNPAEALQAAQWAEVWEAHSPAPLHIQATALDSMQKVAEARKVMERCCQKFPGDATSWYLLGLGRAGEGDLIGGREALMKALSLEPQFESAQRNLNAIEAALEQDS